MSATMASRRGRSMSLLALAAVLCCVVASANNADPFDMHRFLAPQDWLSDANTALLPAAAAAAAAAAAPAHGPAPAAAAAAAPAPASAADSLRFKSTEQHAASANLEVQAPAAPAAQAPPAASPAELADKLLSDLSKPWDESEAQLNDERSKAASIDSKDKYFHQEESEKLRFREKLSAPAAPAPSTTPAASTPAAAAGTAASPVEADSMRFEQQHAAESQAPASPNVYLHAYYQTPVPTSALTGAPLQQQVAQQQATQQYQQIQASLASAREALNTYFRSRQTLGPSRRQPSSASAPGSPSAQPAGAANIDAQMARQQEYYQKYLKAYNKYYNPGGSWGSGLPNPAVTAASAGQPVQPAFQAGAAQPQQQQQQTPVAPATVIGGAAAPALAVAAVQSGAGLLHRSGDGQGPLGRLPSMGSRVPGNDNLGLPYQLPIVPSGTVSSRQPGDTFEVQGKRLFHPVVLPDSKPKGYVPPSIVSGVPAIVVGENTQYPVSTSCSSPDCVKPVVVPKVPSYASSIVASPLDGDCGCTTCPCDTPVVSSCGCDTCPCAPAPAPSSSCGCDTCPCSAKQVPKLLVTPDVEECGCNSCPCARPPVNVCGCDTCPCPSTSCGCDTCPCSQQKKVVFSSNNGVTVDEDAYNQAISSASRGSGSDDDDSGRLPDGTASAGPDVDGSGRDRLDSSSPDSDSKKRVLDAVNDELPKTRAGQQHRREVEDEVRRRREELGVPAAGRVLSEANGKHGTVLELDPSHPKARSIRKSVENPEDDDDGVSGDMFGPMQQQMRELEMDRRRLMAQVSKTRRAIDGLGMSRNVDDVMSENIKLDLPPLDPPAPARAASRPEKEAEARKNATKNATKPDKFKNKVGSAALMMFMDDPDAVNATLTNATSSNKTDSEVAKDLAKLEGSRQEVPSERKRLEEELLAIRLKKDADRKIAKAKDSGKEPSKVSRSESALAGDIVQKLETMKTASPEEQQRLSEEVARETEKLSELERKEEDAERAEKQKLAAKKLEEDLKARTAAKESESKESGSPAAGPADHDQEHLMIRDFIEDQVEFNKKVSQELETVEQELHGGPLPSHELGAAHLPVDALLRRHRRHLDLDKLQLSDDDGSDPLGELGPRVGPMQRAAADSDSAEPRLVLDPTDPNTVVHESTRLIFAKDHRSAHPNDVAFQVAAPLGDFVAPLHVMPPRLPSLPSVPDLHILPIRGGRQVTGALDSSVSPANVEIYRHPSIPMIKVHHVRSYPLLRFQSQEPPAVHHYARSSASPSGSELAQEIRLLLDESRVLERSL